MFPFVWKNIEKSKNNFVNTPMEATLRFQTCRDGYWPFLVTMNRYYYLIISGKRLNWFEALVSEVTAVGE